jgi:hypothetical protein
MITNQINRNGFEETTSGLYITKDPAAQLIYTLDWTNWLEGGDVITSATWTVVARRNDPSAIVIESSNFTSNLTYVELSGGQVSKTYVASVVIVTANLLTDSRKFKIDVKDRYG